MFDMECACVGGLDRAHLHLMSTSVKSDHSSLKNAIENLYLIEKLYQIYFFKGT